MAINKLDTGAIQDNAITNAKMADDAVGVADLAATGTPSNTTFLRGDNAWATPTDTDTNTTYSVQDGELSQNNFTNDDHTKLNNIEASADVTDATNVAAAGALMDSELAGIAAVKATTGTFLTADQTKLDGIATSANNYVHPNHSGDVVSAADGAMTIQTDAVDIAMLSATGTPSATTFLRGDNAWTTVDTTTLENNIAMLGFYRATDHSKAKYNLVDQVIDDYNDSTGIDAANSTNEALSSGVYAGATVISPTGATSTDTSISGYTTLVLSAGSGSVVIPNSANVTMLVVGGGGGGAKTSGGGAGAGGLIYKATHALTAQTYSWVRGAGGVGTASVGVAGNVGADSTWTDASSNVEFTAKGGGGGGQQNTVGTNGGSGGGAGHDVDGARSATQSSQSGDSGTYGFGFDGGQGTEADTYNTGGGGGAGSAGQSAAASYSGDGGTGKDYGATFGTSVGDGGWFASGGGGGYVVNVDGLVGHASAGGGGQGGANLSGGNSGQALTGGGAGGAGGQGSGTTGSGGSGIILIRYANDAFTSTSDLTLQSTDSTASTTPTTGDMVTLIENSAGTATLNTDIKGYISRDSGANFTQGTLVDEGSWGTNKKILAFHDLDISGQPSGTAICYKITTHNQSASKETRIHATSLAWA